MAVLDDGFREVRFVGVTAEEAMRLAGRLPLPPYIAREPDRGGRTRGTRPCTPSGKAASRRRRPGCTSRRRILDALETKGVELARLDLEVGPGTFKPVEVEDPSRHPMHPERFDLPPNDRRAIARLRQRGGELWAVGTTVVRALESAAREDGSLQTGRQETRLLIAPGYRFRVVDRLITNFHLPRSTLLMLVSAFGGHERTMAAYRHAVERRYRFYSYGDAMVVCEL